MVVALPGPDHAGVEVDEVGSGVVADAAHGHREPCGPDLTNADILHADVHGLSLDVHAVLCNAAVVASKPAIGFG